MRDRGAAGPRGAEEEDRERKLSRSGVGGARRQLRFGPWPSVGRGGVRHQPAQRGSHGGGSCDLASATIAIGGTPAVVAASAEGRIVYVTSLEGKALTMVDAAARSVTGRIDIGGGLFGIAVAPNGKASTRSNMRKL